MRNITEKELQDKLDAFYKKESFLEFSPDLGVFYDNRAIGIWEPFGENQMNIVLFHKGENDPEYFQVIKDMVTNTKEDKTMTSKTQLMEQAKALNIKGRSKMNKDQLAKAIQEKQQSGATSIDQLIPAFDQGAVNNPESTTKGVTKMREALESSKEKKDMHITIEEASQVSENVDIDKVQRFANELYGTSYKMGQTYIKVSANSGQALDNSKPGYIFCGSEYVGKVVKVNGEFHIAFDYGDSNECVNISKFNKEVQEEAPVLNANVFYCNVWTRDGRTIYFFNQKWMNVNRTRDDLVARAEGVLGNTQAKSRNKAVVLQIGEKWVVITKVVKDGALVTKSVFADTMDLRKNNRR